MSHKLVYEKILQTISHKYLYIKKNQDRSILIIGISLQECSFEVFFQKWKCFFKKLFEEEDAVSLGFLDFDLIWFIPDNFNPISLLLLNPQCCTHQIGVWCQWFLTMPNTSSATTMDSKSLTQITKMKNCRKILVARILAHTCAVTSFPSLFTFTVAVIGDRVVFQFAIGPTGARGEAEGRALWWNLGRTTYRLARGRLFRLWRRGWRSGRCCGLRCRRCSNWCCISLCGSTNRSHINY